MGKNKIVLFFGYVLNFFKHLKFEKQLSGNENEMLELINEFVNEVSVDKIHCDSQGKKYFIVDGTRTLAVDGNTNKVFLLLDEPNCGKRFYNGIYNEESVTLFIDLIVTTKHLHTEKIYQSILTHQSELLKDFRSKA